ncbi:hypothetical protein FD25_GL002605 [Levilactobacillus acidifarinae DSM 19394]|uniref:Uncharacterized protein n=1 Tax=Levilactobacillus acidifarinae DSM 19394 = JCM 15949 TaxID=1423715 RepID=A0A0R1LJW1_9LACO|nr:hypothetical protein FD25_GL002605 [Levilactobacillus acidifarinae DSM 19394]
MNVVVVSGYHGVGHQKALVCRLFVKQSLRQIYHNREMAKFGRSGRFVILQFYPPEK